MMKKPFRTLLFCGLLCLLLSFVLTASADDLPTNYAKARYPSEKLNILLLNDLPDNY